MKAIADQRGSEDDVNDLVWRHRSLGELIPIRIDAQRTASNL